MPISILSFIHKEFIGNAKNHISIGNGVGTRETMCYLKDVEIYLLTTLCVYALSTKKKHLKRFNIKNLIKS